MSDVTWRPIPCTLNYEASSIGQIRSMDRTITDTVGHVYKHSGRQLKLINKRGYMFVTVTYTDGTSKSTRVHRLVCKAFHGLPADESLDVRHLNGDSTDNRPENLAWGTRSENMYDKVRHGRHWQANKTHCKNGHEFTPDNLAMTVRGRKCRACVRDASERRRRENPEKTREYKRLYAQKRRQDPQTYERMLQNSRDWKRRQRKESP